MNSKMVYRLLMSGILWLACACQAQDVKPPDYRIVLLTMSVEAGNHRVTAARIVNSPVRLVPDPARTSGNVLNYSVTNLQGQVLVEGSISDPQLVRSPLPQKGEPFEDHKVVQLPQTEYLLRLPYRDGMRYLQLGKGTRIDLAPWLSAH